MNILIITSVYPDSENTSNENVTKVVKYFATSWQEMGHKVYVVHNSHKYPTMIHRLPQSLRKKLATKINFYIPDYADISEKRFCIDGIEGIRIPILKLRPHKKVNDKLANRQAEKIIGQLNDLNFIPDLIISHWVCPQIQILQRLKKEWSGVKTSLVLHGNDYIYDKDFEIERYLKYVDVLGCRSKTEAVSVRNGLGLKKPPFVCYSGIPDSYVNNSIFEGEKFNHYEPLKICFVGRLVKYKNVDLLIRAIKRVGSSCSCVLEIVGEGAEKENLIHLASELGIDKQIVFHGRKTRDVVLNIMKKSHVFAMISKGEVFGLTYLEAMSASCIPIGSIGEGIDGVIVNEKNGFLVSPNNEIELADRISQLYALSKNRMLELSRAAYETAKEFTDTKMAELYLTNVLKGNEE